MKKYFSFTNVLLMIVVALLVANLLPKPQSVETKVITPTMPERPKYVGPFDSNGRQASVDVDGSCRRIDEWAKVPGVVVRYRVTGSEVSGVRAEVKIQVYPVVVIKDNIQTWTVDFGYSPVRVYAQDGHYYSGVAESEQVQPMDPAPYINRASQILSDNRSETITSTWGWDSDRGWYPIKGHCN